jgi:hypothetical protein
MFLSLISCSSGDEEEDKSFLETHGGTVWKLGTPEDGLSVYAKINSSESNPFEIWVYDSGGECYDYESITDAGSPEVIENRENKVEIRIGGTSGEYAILTMTVSGDVLRVELNSYDEGGLVEEQKFILERTSDNVNDLVKCAS